MTGENLGGGLLRHTQEQECVGSGRETDRAAELEGVGCSKTKKPYLQENCIQCSHDQLYIVRALLNKQSFNQPDKRVKPLNYCHIRQHE